MNARRLIRLLKPSAIALAVILAVVAADVTLAASAAETGLDATAAAAYGTGRSQASLATLVGQIIGALLSLLGVLLVVLVIYAGFLWMTAQGSEDKVKTAKKILTNAVIGMVLIFAAYAITNFVVEQVAVSTIGGEVTSGNPTLDECISGCAGDSNCIEGCSQYLR
jgi:hypothetical protein